MAEVFRVLDFWYSNFNIDACVKGKIIELNGIYHTHDLEHIDNDFFVSASEDGNLVSLNKDVALTSLRCVIENSAINFSTISFCSDVFFFTI